MDRGDFSGYYGVVIWIASRNDGKVVLRRMMGHMARALPDAIRQNDYRNFMLPYPYFARPSAWGSRSRTSIFSFVHPKPCKTKRPKLMFEPFLRSGRLDSN